MGHYSNKKIHFIVGLGRSGTTLMVSTLNRNPNVIANPESLFLLHFIYRFGGQKTLSPHKVKQFSERIFDIKAGKFVGLRIWLMDKENLKNTLIHLPGNIHLEELTKCVHMHSFLGRKKENASVIIDKNPPYTKHLPKLLREFPESKFIALVRDYRDNAISRKTYQLDMVNDYVYHAVVWKNYNQTILQAKAKHPDRLMVIRYEDFVCDFDRVMLEVAAFLDIKPEFPLSDRTQAEQFEQITAHLNEEEKNYFIKMHGRILEKPDGSKIGQWRGVLGKKELAAMERICGKTGMSFGYSTESKTKINFRIRISIAKAKFFHAIENFVHHAFFRSPFFLRDFAGFIRRGFRKKS